MPDISAIMPVYNGEKYIRETIDSILNQTFTNFEFIIVNDGSTDDTQEIVESYNDERIKLYKLRENLGVGAASNYAVRKAQGKYIARVDSDDIYHKNRFSLQKRFLDQNTDISIVKSFVEFFSDEHYKKTERFHTLKNILEKNKNGAVSATDISEKIYWHMCVPHTSLMVRSEVFEDIQYEDLRCFEDYKLVYDMNEKGYKFGTVEEFLVRIRVRDQSTSVVYQNLLYETAYYIKKRIINNLFNDDAEVFLWGAGSFGETVSQVLKENNLLIRGFIDSDPLKQGTELLGYLVYSPRILGSQKNQNPKVIVSSQPGMNSIVRQLDKIGLKHLDDYVVFC